MSCMSSAYECGGRFPHAQVLDRNKGGSSASQSAGGAAQAGAQATPSLADALASQLSAAAAGQGPAPAPQAAPTDESAGGNAPPSDWVDGQPTSPDTGLSAAPEPAPAPAPAAQLPPAIAPAPAQAMAPAYARQTAAPITPAAAVRPMPELPLAPGAWAPGVCLSCCIVLTLVWDCQMCCTLPCMQRL